MNFWLLLIPFTTSILGFICTWLTVTILFKPEQPIRIPGFFSFQGIFPKHQQRIADRIGKLAAEELVPKEDLRSRMVTGNDLESMKFYIEEKVDDYLHHTFPVKYPVASVFFSKGRREKIKADLLEQVDRFAPDVLDRIVAEMEAKIDIEELVMEKVNHISPGQLERIFADILKREYGKLSMAGAAIGLLFGMAQLGFLVLLN